MNYPFNNLEPRSSAPYEILGEFCLENQKYWVVSLDCNIETNLLHKVPEFEMQSDHSSLISFSFKLNGQYCAIIHQSDKTDTAGADLSTLLTGREMQIVMLVAQGYANKGIAKQLHISEWTVSTYLRRLFAKLGVDSRAAMVYRCAAFIRKVDQVKIHPERLVE
jgi:DNA-binding CsgD family transcriptional regulator